MATMVLLSCAAETTLVMASAALGFVRLERATTATRIPTTTAAMSRGTIGGSVHLALSISSVMGMCPASGASAGFAFTGAFVFAGLLGGGGVGLVSSGIEFAPGTAYSCEMLKARLAGNREDAAPTKTPPAPACLCGQSWRTLPPEGYSGRPVSSAMRGEAAKRHNVSSPCAKCGGHPY